MNVRHDFGAREQRFFVVTSQGVNSSAVWPRLFVPGVQIDTPLSYYIERVLRDILLKLDFLTQKRSYLEHYFILFIYFKRELLFCYRLLQILFYYRSYFCTIEA